MGVLTKDQLDLVIELESECSVLMAGHGPYVQGGVVACLIARHLASFDDDATQRETERVLIDTARELAVIYRRVKEDGCPSTRLDS